MGLAHAQDRPVRPLSAPVAVDMNYYAYAMAFLAHDGKTTFRFAGLFLGGI